MRAVTRKRWGEDLTPWHEMETLGDRMRRLIEYPSFTPSLFRGPRLIDNTDWLPAVELLEEDGEFVLTAELPGMSKGDVDVSVEDGVLTLKGEKKFVHEEARGRLHVREREYGAFERAFTLPRNVDAEKIHADFHDGVVEIHMPKGEEAKSKHIEIK